MPKRVTCVPPSSPTSLILNSIASHNPTRRRAASTHRQRRDTKRLSFEPLEVRLLLSADPCDIQSLRCYFLASQMMSWANDVLDRPAEIAQSADSPDLSLDTQSLILRLRPGADARALLSDLLPGATICDTFELVSDLYRINLPQESIVQTAVATLTAMDAVVYAQPNYLLQFDGVTLPNDPRFSSLWGLHNAGQTGGTPDADIDAPEAWALSTGRESVIVAVIDTGVDYTHSDLAANIWTNPGEIAGDGIDNDGNGFVDDVHGWDFVNGDNDPMDDNNHGTHVAGTIAAVGNNGTGVTGVGWNVQIMPLKIADLNGSASLYDAMLALQYAVSMGATVSNNSYGGASNSTAFADAIAAAGQAGHVFVAAAGNFGTNNDLIAQYPANVPLGNVIAVAATDHRDARPSWSNYGATTVDLGAPGVSILSTVPGGGYGWMSGTSMATPHVAGAVALVQSVRPDYSVAEVVDAILDGVDPVASMAGITVSGGRLNVAGTLHLAASMNAELYVHCDGQNIVDGSGSIAFDRTIQSVPRSLTFSVENIGLDASAAPLTLGSLTLPAGFTLISDFGSRSLSAGESTTFTVRLDAAVAGSFAGQLSFATSDPEESLFNFTISGSVLPNNVVQILDDGDVGYSTTGPWIPNSDWRYFSGDFQWVVPGNGSAAALWDFPVVPGIYQVAATWVPASYWASNAPFIVGDDSHQTTVTVNQQVAPNDFSANGAYWETLGQFEIAGNNLFVRLADAANNYVVADAIRVERVANLPQESDPTAADDAEATAALIGHWSFSSGSGTTAFDSSPYGSNHAGLMVGDPQWNDYGIAGSITLDGDGDGVVITSSTDLNLSTVTARTVSGWFYVDDTAVNSRAQIIYEEGGEARGLSIYVFDGRLYAGGWNMPSTESNWAGTFLSTDQIESHRWHHVALVLNGTSTVTADALRGYLDGVQFGSGAGSQLWAHADPTGLGQAAAKARLHNGLFDVTLPNGGQALAGMIDELSVYNRVLTASEIAELATVQPAAPSTLNLIVAADSVWENGSAVSGTLTRSGDVSQPLVVNLTSSVPGRLAVPATVTFGAGESTQTFPLTPQDNVLSDGSVQVTITASATDYISGQDPVLVLDDEPSSTSLVAYWAFNEGSGTVAGDTSPYGQNHSGTLVGDTTWSPAGLGHSLQFDGDGDAVAVPDSSDINTSVVTQRSISLWFAAHDVASSTQPQVLLEEGGIARGLNIYLYGGRLYVGGWNADSNESNWQGTFLSTDQIESGRWHHVVLVLNGTATTSADAMQAYLDGQLFGSGEGSQLWAHGDNTGIGQVAEFTRYHTGAISGVLDGFAGLMDEVRIYNRALIAAEVQVLASQQLVMPNQLRLSLGSHTVWENGSTLQGTVTRDGDVTESLTVMLNSSDTSEATVPASVTIAAGQTQATFTVTLPDDAASDATQYVVIAAAAADYLDASVTLEVLDNEPSENQLVAHWTLDELSGTLVSDSSPSGLSNVGTLGGSAVRVDQGLGRAVLLDGQASYITMADSSDINTSTVGWRSVSLWFAVDDASLTSRKQVLFEEGGIARGLNVYLFGGRLYVGGWNAPANESGWTGTFLSTDQIQSGRWHHVTLVLEGEATMAEGSLRGYLDGVEFGRGAGSQVWAHGDNTGIGQVAEYTLFHTGEAGSAAHGLAGMIDEVRVYNRALTAAEIEVLADQQLVITERLQLSIAAGSLAEQGGASQATVTRTGDMSSELVVSLSSSDVSEATVPTSVTIAAGAASATFAVTAVDDSVRDRVQDVTITASATGLTNGVDRVAVSDNEKVLVHGVVQNVSNDWITVTLPQSYASMVVVTTPNYTESHVPVVTRIRDAGGNAFQLRVDRTDGLSAAVPGVSVHYVVADEGVYTQAADGVKLEVVKYSSTVTDYAGNWQGESRSYAQTYVSPVVLGQVQTYNDSDFSVFWSRGATSSAPASSSVLRVGKHVGEDPDTTRVAETVGYLVLESGLMTVDGEKVAIGVGPATVQGMDNSPPFNYALSGLSAASGAVASLAGIYGAQGGWAVLHGSTPLTATRLQLAADEDQALDAERAHVAERAGYLVFGESTSPLSSAAASDAAFALDQTFDAIDSLLARAMM